MAKNTVNNYLKSRWHARFLIKTIMGLIKLQEKPNGDTILAITTAAVRGYAKGYFKNPTGKQEEGIYTELQRYALERVNRNGRDKLLMEDYLKSIHMAVEQVWGGEPYTAAIGKHNSVFPLDLFSEENLDMISKHSQEQFKAKFFCSDIEPVIGMLVFDDKEGLDAFNAWMGKTFPELRHEMLDDDDDVISIED